MYGKPNNPYQTNALNRRAPRAPINKLTRPLRFQSGGGVSAMRLMGEDVSGQVKDMYATESSKQEQVLGEKSDYKAAEAKMREAQAKARKRMPKWLRALISFIPGVGGPLGALIESLEQRKNLRSAAKIAGEGKAGYAGLRGSEEGFESMETELKDMANKAPL